MLYSVFETLIQDLSPRDRNACRKVMAKLPCSTFHLTPPERKQLVFLERHGAIEYVTATETWKEKK